MADRDPDMDRKIARGLIVQEFGPEGVDLLDYLQHVSRADPETINGGEHT